MDASERGDGEKMAKVTNNVTEGDIKGGHGISFRAQQNNIDFEILLKVKNLSMETHYMGIYSIPSMTKSRAGRRSITFRTGCLYRQVGTKDGMV